MESVVKAIGKPVSFSDASTLQDENDLSINKSDTDIQSRLPNESARKRRHSSEKYEASSERYLIFYDTCILVCFTKVYFTF